MRRKQEEESKANLFFMITPFPLASDDEDTTRLVGRASRSKVGVVGPSANGRIKAGPTRRRSGDDLVLVGEPQPFSGWLVELLGRLDQERPSRAPEADPVIPFLE